jgi:hypothetical protein
VNFSIRDDCDFSSNATQPRKHIHLKLGIIFLLPVFGGHLSHLAIYDAAFQD